MRHGAGNRHHLAVGQREIADPGLQVDGQPHAVGNRFCLATHPARIEQGRRAAAAQPVECQIGGDIEVGDDTVIDVLMNGDDAGADRLRRRFWREVLRCEVVAGEAHRAAAALVDAADDFDQRGFAGAVGTHQHGYFAGMQIERDAAKHLDMAEGLPQPVDAEHGIIAHSFLPDHDARDCSVNCQHD